MENEINLDYVYFLVDWGLWGLASYVVEQVTLVAYKPTSGTLVELGTIRNAQVCGLGDVLVKVKVGSEKNICRFLSLWTFLSLCASLSVSTLDLNMFFTKFGNIRSVIPEEKKTSHLEICLKNVANKVPPYSLLGSTFPVLVYCMGQLPMWTRWETSRCSEKVFFEAFYRFMKVGNRNVLALN